MWIDIGVNLTSSQFKTDREQVVERALAAQVQKMVITGTDLAASQQAVALAAAQPDILSATAGLHPHHASQWGPDLASELKALAKLPQVKAWGECGLDFNRMHSPAKVQEKAFSQQLELAVELGLPVFLHERDASERHLAILDEFRDALVRVVVHCFTGDRNSLFAYLDRDCYIGITGWICDERRGLELQRLVANIPDNRLMLETDAPYLLPRSLKPKPETRRNEPCYLPEVARQVALCRGQSLQQVQQATWRNSVEFFGLAATPEGPQRME